MFSDEIEREFMQHGFPDLEAPGNNTSVVGSLNLFTEGEIQGTLMSPKRSLAVTTDFEMGL